MYRMSKIHLKAVFGFFRLLLLLQLYYHHQFTLAEATKNGIESNLTNELTNDGANVLSLNKRMKQIENQNRHQDLEIAKLKSTAVKHRKTINQLEGRVAQLEAASAISSFLVRPKRPYRLLPVPILTGYVI